MLNVKQKGVRGPILIGPKQLSSAFELAVETVKGSEYENSKYGSPKITVYHKDGESTQVDSVDAALQIPNRSRNRIQRIRINSGLLNPTVTLRLGSDWFDRIGAEIEITGHPDSNSRISDQFEITFNQERDFLFTLLSQHTFVITLVTILIGNLALGFLSGGNLREILSWFSQGTYAKFLPYFIVFWMMPFSVLWLPIEALITRWIGSAIFTWGDGAVSFRKKEIILKTLLVVIPIGTLTSVLSNFIYK